MYAQNENFIFKNRTTNRLESLNEKLKQVITRYSTLLNIFTDLMISVSVTSVERDHRAPTLGERIPVWNENSDDVELLIREILTKFATDHVASEYWASVKVTFSNVQGNCAILNAKRQVISATTVSVLTVFVLVLPSQWDCSVGIYDTIKKITVTTCF